MVYEAVGRASTVTAALERVDIGGTVVVLGVASPADVGTLSPFDVWARQLTVSGAWGVETTFGSALALLEPLGVERLATHDLPLAEIEEALGSPEPAAAARCCSSATRPSPRRPADAHAPPGPRDDGADRRRPLPPHAHREPLDARRHARVPRRRANPWHYHRESDELFQLMEGEAAFFVGDEIVAAVAGDSVLVDTGLPHAIVVGEGAPLVLLAVVSPNLRTTPGSTARRAGGGRARRSLTARSPTATECSRPQRALEGSGHHSRSEERAVPASTDTSQAVKRSRWCLRPLPATPSWWTQHVELVTGTSPEQQRGLWLDGAERDQHQDELVAMIRAGQLAVARLDGRLVGAVRLQRLDAGLGELGMLVASPEHRGVGIGRELVAFAERWARAQGLAQMQLELLVPQTWSHPVKEFLRGWYTRIGYEPVRGGRLGEAYPELEPLLATPCDFAIFHKTL